MTRGKRKEMSTVGLITWFGIRNIGASNECRLMPLVNLPGFYFSFSGTLSFQTICGVFMYQIDYVITLPSQERVEFNLEFDQAFQLRVPPREHWPRWTELAFCRCDHCPLDPQSVPRCPTAASLVRVLEAVDGWTSFEEVEVEVRVPQRQILAKASIQDVLRSLMGLMIPASGCPYSAFLRPMARFHLPLSDVDETLYRVTSMFCLAQYLRASAGARVSDGFGGLAIIYGDLNRVNRALVERLRPVCAKDSFVNAVVLLDVFTQLLPLQFDEPLMGLSPLFLAYLEDNSQAKDERTASLDA